MTRRFVRTAAAVALLVPTLVACSDGQDVVHAGAPRTVTPPPPPPVPTKPSLVRYVSPTGDNHATGSIDRPWRTLTHALRRIYAGQVLFVRGGTYHEQIDHVRLHDGTSTAPITVLSYPGENPVLDGSVSLRRPEYWLIDNLDVAGDQHARSQPSFMVKVIGGQHWTWENSEFSGTTGRANVLITGFGVGEPFGFRFVGNCLHGLPSPPAGSTNLFLGSMVSGASGTVARNVVFNSEDQPNVRIGSGAGAPVRVQVRLNTIYGGALGIDVRGRPHHVKISKNIVGGGSAPAMIRFPRGRTRGVRLISNIAVNTEQLLRPEVRKMVQKQQRGYGNLAVSQDPGFVDTSRCDGFRPGLDAVLPYGALAP
ncbi:DUF1565 domain-containing protein [Nocardioides cynanchi]|uniref:DUF1565 domain-containing protein n=1 Tax=Nocardioides cynanchi TaxID=2558918 RepID=UPI00177A96F5|nr:DUF1565 domain-containing protein [Nocardioides cynanchi]